MSRISQLTELTTPHDNDLLPIVDVSDTTQASSGSTKYIKVGNLPIQSGVVTDADLQAALENLGDYLPRTQPTLPNKSWIDGETVKVSRAWILANGTWDDEGAWYDNQTWSDN